MDDGKLIALRLPIPIEQVDFRIQSISESGWALMLAYKDARVDMDRLDDVLGSDNWQRLNELIDGQLFCKVGIWSEGKSQWVWKQDVGTESNTEKEKGRASDAFKRACFNVGIGRELYDYPLILVQLNEGEFYVRDGKGKSTYALRLKDWVWHSNRTDPDEHGKTEIKTLSAVDDKGNQRFNYPRGSAPPAQSSAPQQQSSQDSSAQSADDKPWYNAYEKEKEGLQSMVNSGTKPESLVIYLRKAYRVNKKVSEAIMALKTEAR